MAEKISDKNSNYPERTAPLPLGSLVLHDADAKNPTCLSVVTKLRRNGLVESRYIHPDMERRNKIWVNPPRALLDPGPFGIDASVQDGVLIIDVDPARATARYKDGKPASPPRRAWSEAFDLATGERVPVPIGDERSYFASSP
jgi:hypothetical protein